MNYIAATLGLLLAVIGCGPIDLEYSTDLLYRGEQSIDAKLSANTSSPKPRAKKPAPPKKPPVAKPAASTNINLTSICSNIGSSLKKLTPYKRYSFPTANDLKNAFVSSHNKIRTSYQLPNLVWDPEIAAYAQAWANYLRDNNQCGMQHRSNVGKQEGKKYGENLAWNMVSPAFLPNEFVGSPEAAVLNWSNECKDYRYGSNDCKAGEQCGHFTQVVWKASQKFGCGVATCRNAGSQSEIWVCNYDPPGNMTVITNGKVDKQKPF